MPYHSPFKRITLVVLLAGCFLWTKKETIKRLLPGNSPNTNALVEFGPMPMIPDIPEIPDFPKEQELLLPQQQELMEQQFELKEELLKELKEKIDRIKIIQAD